MVSRSHRASSILQSITSTSTVRRGGLSTSTTKSQKTWPKFPVRAVGLWLTMSVSSISRPFLKSPPPQASPTHDESSFPDSCFDRPLLARPSLPVVSLPVVSFFGHSCFGPRTCCVRCLSRVEVRQVEFGGLVHCPFRFEEKNAGAKGHDAR